MTGRVLLMHDVPIFLVRFVLASLFGVAAWGKLRDSPGTRQSLEAFGAPAAATPALAVLLPVLEAACSIALLTRWAWWGALGALALLAMFMLAIAAAMARGRRVDCNCFGRLHSAPAGWSTLSRNAILAGIAAIVVARGPGQTGPNLLTIVRLAAGVVPPFVLAWGLVTVAVGIWFYWSLPTEPPRRVPAVRAGSRPQPSPALREVGPPPRTVEALAAGSEAPPFALAGLHGQTITLDDLGRNGHPVLLVFTRPNCPACEAVLPDVGRWQRELADRLVVMPVSQSGLEENEQKAATHRLVEVLLQEADEASVAYGIQLIPSGVLVTDGRIAGPYAEGVVAIRELVKRTTGPDSGGESGGRPSPTASGFEPS